MFLAGVGIFLNHLSVARYGAEGVADFVRNPCGKLADGGQFSGLNELGLPALKFARSI